KSLKEYFLKEESGRYMHSFLKDYVLCFLLLSLMFRNQDRKYRAFLHIFFIYVVFLNKFNTSEVFPHFIY
ncbi:MAG: hypothetical protein MUO82_07620, partial [Candidatus Thermoplasmatota archaeon]|nr:hypothetical protein [Candidatus Thermoplasmatota archaeon]